MDDVFIQRHDLYARQLDNGRYVCVHEPLTQAHLEAHLRGDITLGTYLLDAESKGRFLVLDADDDPDWRRLQGVSTVLEGMERRVILSAAGVVGISGCFSRSRYLDERFASSAEVY